MKKKNKKNLENEIFKRDKSELVEELRPIDMSNEKSIPSNQSLKILSLGIAFILILISALFVYLVWDSGFLTPLLLSIFVVVVVLINLLVTYLLFSQGHIWKRASGFVLLVLMGAVFLYGSNAFENLNSSLERMNTELDDSGEYSLVVRANNEFTLLSDVRGIDIAYANLLADEGITELESKGYTMGAEYIAYPQLASALLQGDERVILINESFRELIDEIYPSFTSSTRKLVASAEDVEQPNTGGVTPDETDPGVIVPNPDDPEDNNEGNTEGNTETPLETLPAEQVKPQVPQNHSSYEDIYVDGTKPFTFYISGLDSGGSINSSGRSDVNIVGAINPRTKKVTLVHIPRDAYVVLGGTGGYRDKLTHAGVLGINSSLGSVENLFGRDISTYAKVNFRSLINIVDTLGGITVYNPVAFSAGGYNFPVGNVRMNGNMALTYVRERKAFGGGDLARGQNQMRVIEAMIREALQPAILTNYNSLLNSVSNSVRTNLSSSAIAKIVQGQLASGGGWSFQSIGVTGSSRRGLSSYMMPGYNLSFVVLSEGSLANARAAINNTMK